MKRSIYAYSVDVLLSFKQTILLYSCRIQNWDSLCLHGCVVQNKTWNSCQCQSSPQKMTSSVIWVFHHSVSFGHVSVSFHLCQCSFSLSLSAVALSVLRSSEEQTPIPQNKFMGDIEELAASYERKLIEVSVVLIHIATERRISVNCFSSLFIIKSRKFPGSLQFITWATYCKC